MKTIHPRRTSLYVATHMLLASVPALATDYTSTQTANGNHLDLSDSTVTVDGYLTHGAQALNAGSVSASDVDVVTRGNSAYGLFANGGDSSIDFTGGSISTSGTDAIAVRAVGASTITLTDSRIGTTGAGGWGVLAMGGGATVEMRGGTIDVQSTGALGYNGGHLVLGRNSDGDGVVVNTTGAGGRGVRADNGTVDIDGATINVDSVAGSGSAPSGLSSITQGRLTAVDTTIHASKDLGIGAVAGGNAYLGMLRGSITTGGANGYGLRAYTASTLEADDLAVVTTGSNAHAAFVNDTGSRMVLRGNTIATSGLRAFGGVATGAGYLGMSGTSVLTTGDRAEGLRADGADSLMRAEGSTIDTRGMEAHGAHAINGGRIELVQDVGGKGVAIHTTGDNSRGLWAEAGASASAVGATILTEGHRIEGPGRTAGSGGAVASSGSSVSLADSRIETRGRGADGVDAEGKGSSLHMSGGSILTRGDNSKGAAVYGGGNRLGLDHVDVRTEGTSARGLVASGVLDGVASVADVVGGSIATGGLFSVGVQAMNAAVIDLDGTAVTTTGNQGHAIEALTGGVVNIRNADIRTTNQLAMGAHVQGAGSAVTLDNSRITTEGYQSYGIRVEDNARLDMTNATVETMSDNSHGVDIHNATARIVGSRIETHGWADGLMAWAGSDLELSDSSIVSRAGSSNLFLADAKAKVTNTSLLAEGYFANGAKVWNSTVEIGDTDIVMKGDRSTGFESYGSQVDAKNLLVRMEGADSVGLEIGGSTFNLDGGGIVSTIGTAISSASGSIAASNGAVIVGGGGLLLDLSSELATNLAMTGGVHAEGDIRFGDDADTDGNGVIDRVSTVSLDDGSYWAGATDAVSSLSLDGGSLWRMTGSSIVDTLDLNGSMIDFVAPGARDTGYKTLDVLGNLSGTGGAIGLNTLLDAGGALSEQKTDRVLVHGDVTTTGTTLLDVHGQGNGALTDTNRNGIIDADEGISLVQVAGASRADAFGLKGGYVAAGPWQYTLHAFGPGEADQGQNALGTGDLNWDYRLGNAFVTDPGHGGGEDPNPGDGDGENPAPNPGEETGGGQARPAVIPQLPSYISAPTALLAYGNQTIDTLHQRLGEIRNVTPGAGGEVFARYIGSQQRYRSDLGFTRYGYDFDQQTNALQLGGSLLGWSGDRSSIRAGWALDKGTTRVTPKAADGGSRATYDANGVSAWLTWQQDNGLYVDAIVGGQRFHGNVSTDLRGSDVGKVRANGWTASVEAGYPITLGQGWAIEPQAQIKRQSLSFRTIDDVDGVTTKIAPVGQTTARLGARITKTDEAKLAPYLRADVIRTVGGRAQVTASNTAWDLSETFVGGRVGTSYRIGAGLSSQLTKNVALYGEANYQKGTGGNGFRGWAGTAGVRLDF